MRRPWWMWVTSVGLLAVLAWMLFLAPGGSAPWWAFVLWSAVWLLLLAVTGPTTRWQWLGAVVFCALLTLGALLDFPRVLPWVYVTLLGVVVLLEWLSRRRTAARAGE
jgi:hypothetical protein